MADPVPCLVCLAPVAATFSAKRNRQYQPKFCSVECRRVHRKSYLRKWGSANKGHVNAYRRGRLPKWNKDFYARNSERRKQQRREWYRANAEVAKATAKEYAAKHPDVIRAVSRKSRATRRARLLSAFVEPVHPATVFERDKGVCGICMKPVEPNSPWEVDHIVPLSKGGIHAYANVQLAHRSCNRAKGATVSAEVAA